MKDSTIAIEIPGNLLELGLQPSDIQRRVSEWLVLSLFTEERISSGKAAALLGMSRVAFLALLRNRGIAYVDYSPGELSDEFATVAELKVDFT